MQILLVLVGYNEHHNEFLGTNKKHKTSWLFEWVLVLRNMVWQARVII